MLLAILLVRRLVPHQTMARHNDVAGVIFAIMGVTYAVVLALIIFALWEKHAETRHILDREANSVGSFRVPPEADRSRGCSSSAPRRLPPPPRPCDTTHDPGTPAALCAATATALVTSSGEFAWLEYRSRA